ncbi:hypothetical protein CRG98_047513 [Punica granatum]|uniref:Uncharacterized protein n=1 Tax=Punica granatum TaxID=22663 RepID=A0A2I0HK72_PUNGR|nr:hypothetical protein CRG98_047513 [Punica granatum]
MYIPGFKEGLDSKILNMMSIGSLGGSSRLLCSSSSGQRFHTGDYKALRHGSTNMDVLIALVMNEACFYSVYSVLRAAISPNFKGTDFFKISSMLISFILLRKYLEVLERKDFRGHCQANEFGVRDSNTANTRQ